MNLLPAHGMDRLVFRHGPSGIHRAPADAAAGPLDGGVGRLLSIRHFA
jgi:hypothetical protein